MSQKGKNLDSNKSMNKNIYNYLKKFNKRYLLKRRDALKFMGASLALAGIGVSCRRPEEKIVAYNNTPEDMIPGIPSYYSTMQPRIDGSVGLVAESHEGRPTKIEGSLSHPSSMGKADAFSQASIMELYDPDRLKSVLFRKDKGKSNNSNLSNFFNEIKDDLKDFEDKNGEGLSFMHSGLNSPTFVVLQKKILKKFPKARFYTNNPNINNAKKDAIAALYSKNVIIRNDFSKANVILNIQSDPLMKGQNHLINSFDFANKRNVRSVNDARKMNRLYSVEANYSVTGAASDHRLPLSMSRSLSFLKSLISILCNNYSHLWKNSILNIDSFKDFKIDKDIDEKFLKVLASDLAENKEESIIIVGNSLSVESHMLGIILNEMLGKREKTFFIEKSLNMPDLDDGSIESFKKDVEKKGIKMLFLLNSNIVYNSPECLKIKGLLKSIEKVVSHSLYNDETSIISNWSIPLSHYLESFGDGIDGNGNSLIGQPLIAPLYESISEYELLYFIAEGKKESNFNIIKKTWVGLNGFGLSNHAFRKFIHDGVSSVVFKEKTNIQIKITRNLIDMVRRKSCVKENGNNLEIIFTGDYSVGYGSFSNLGWLQELPDPITKIAWGNACLISPKLAKLLSIRSSLNDMVYEANVVKINLDGRTIKIPAFIVPGLSTYSIILHYGYGRKSLGTIADNVGVDVYKISLKHGESYSLGGLVTKTDYLKKIATTQEQFAMNAESLTTIENLSMGKRNPSMSANTQDYINNNLWIKQRGLIDELKEKDNFGDLKPIQMTKSWDYSSGNQWAKVIDLIKCIGCNACTIACQSENNIPIVGELDVMRGRIMHWIRVDRYFVGDLNNPDSVSQPITCMHCENAPCEAVCPVAATVHDEEGVNGMTYNRCIGTRYCANNCPYKVRRFNYLDFSNSGNIYIDPKKRKRQQTLMMQKNPDVTIRYRGVMEKCTYCIQRINRAKLRAKQENRNPNALRENDVKVACEQTCPTNAIYFGSLTDEKSQIVPLKNTDRNYDLLEELNIRPRTSYLAKLRNRNPKLIKV